MAEMEITLITGLLGKSTDGVEKAQHVNCTIRELNCGDILDAEVESETVRILTVEGKPQPFVVSSPALMNAHLLRRQITRIGKISGPLSLDLFKKLTTKDLDAIQETADALAKASVAGLSDGGRVAPGAAAD
jgi:phage FluMu protein gp41